MRFVLCALVLALSALGCGTTPPVRFQTLTNPDVACTDCRTVAFAPSGEIPGFERRPLPTRYLEAARGPVSEELARLGWTIVPAEEADVVIEAGVGRRTRVEEEAIVEDATTRGLFGFPTTVRRYEREIDEATLVFDAIERVSQTHLWHGHAIGTVGREPPSTDEFTGVVVRLLSNFPHAAPPATSGGDCPPSAP